MKKKTTDDGIELKFTKEDSKKEKVKVDALEVEAKIRELTEDLQRTRADFENYRKQIEARELAAKKMVRNATVAKILPLLDDIDRAVVSYAELKPLEKSLAKTMKELGLSKIEIKVGMEFNPELTEAVMAEGEGEKEVIGEVLRPGYYYESEVLRPAMVKVKKI
ncbi:nucleotide exchange factor GrpE [Candidatus Saccharibacteria bacterium]|nr:nucleotide exchange factor GrpE [Candidatus Saccharibacteria bacterium]